MNDKVLDLERLLDDHGVEYHSSGGDWIQMKCPICYVGDGKFGLGWQGKIFNCFRCGRLDRIDVISALLNLSPANTLKTIRRYEVGKTLPKAHYNHSSTILDHKDSVKLPYGSGPLTPKHAKYLSDRNFDPELLQAEYRLTGTGAVGPFAHRIVIPIYRSNKLVCFQGRDITGKSPNKYKSCQDNEAVVPIKSCLYREDFVADNSPIVVTEGPTKVWRLGAGAVCTFGATVTSEQLRRLKRFSKVYLLFDEDEAGQEGAEKTARDLSVTGIKVFIIRVGVKDAADLSCADAAGVMKELLKK